MERTDQNKKGKYVWYITILVLLFVPMAQQLTGLIKFRPLNGSFQEVEKPIFAWSLWLDGQYQTKQELYTNDHIGFRNFFVRLFNQQHYTLYNQARANGVIVGKENYLYEENYIKAYVGSDFIGEEKIKSKTDELKKVSNFLKQNGVDLIVLLAPGKGSFYPEYIPDRFTPNVKSTTNYEVYARELEESGIHFLDFNRWFRDMKATSSYPLFPKTGIHWSKYGELLAADSLVKYINTIQGIPTLPQIHLGEIDVSKRPRDEDNDIEKGMNLLFRIDGLTMGYPKYTIDSETASQPRRILTIADSYYWGMFNWGCSQRIFGGGQFWFYNKQIYPDSYVQPISVDEIKIVDEVLKNRVVILITTDANLPKFDFGFGERFLREIEVSPQQ